MQTSMSSNHTLPVAAGVIRSPIKRFLKQPALVAQRAKFYADLRLSGDDTVDWILDQILFGFEGAFIDFNGNEIDRDTWLVYELWGEDPRRAMNRYKEFALAPPKQRLHENLAEREMAHDFGIQIHTARLKLIS